jgi:hypothetical protein
MLADSGPLSIIEDVYLQQASQKIIILVPDKDQAVVRNSQKQLPSLKKQRNA